MDLKIILFIVPQYNQNPFTINQSENQKQQVWCIQIIFLFDLWSIYSINFKLFCHLFVKIFINKNWIYNSKNLSR